ncbi:glycosyltransferase [Kitasatospora cystarginea]|uniref:Glycosyltransferase n=1 Tax=Kitasatospora cystarginea TaxID=58350 RepID=A0ABN3E8H6_9ACTN
MSRYLFVVPPLVGHVNPVVGVAAELAARGHATAWAGVPELIGRLAGSEAEVFRCAVALAPDAVPERPPELRGPAALKFLWEDFLVPLADAMAPGVAEAIEHFRPDVLVVDQQAVAGALAAERAGLPWATSATTSAELTGPLDGMPLVEGWVRDRLAELRSRLSGPDDPDGPPLNERATNPPRAEGRAGDVSEERGNDRRRRERGSDDRRHRVRAPGGERATNTDPRFSPYLVLAFSTAELASSATSAGGPIRFVGPSLAARPSGTAFPWEWLDPDRALVLVTLGTANSDAGAAFLSHSQTSLRTRSKRLQAVIVDPGGLLGAPALDPDVLVLPHVPQLDLLARAAAVVCHAGHNTVCEALWHGVPLVVAPIRDDQPVVAAQVVAAGTGVRLRFGRTTAERLGQALDAVLDDPAYRAAAQRVGASFRAAGGATAAADHLERLAVERPLTPGSSQ